jgi:hypothetical protein
VSVPSSGVGRNDAQGVGSSGIYTGKGGGGGYEVERSNRREGGVGGVKSVPQAGNRTVML